MKPSIRNSTLNLETPIPEDTPTSTEYDEERLASKYASSNEGSEKEPAPEPRGLLDKDPFSNRTSQALFVAIGKEFPIRLFQTQRLNFMNR